MLGTIRGIFMGANRYTVASFTAGIFLFLTANACLSATYKCKDAKGQTIFSDRSCGNAAVPIQVHDNGMARPSEESIVETKLENAKSNRKYSDKCSFSSYGSQGQEIADSAKEECYKNEVLKESGKSNQVKLTAYNKWKEYDKEAKENLRHQQREANENAREQQREANENAREQQRQQREEEALRRKQNRPLTGHCTSDYAGGMNCVVQ